MAIKIQINGKEENIPDKISISDLLETKGIRQEVVTIEVNGQIIEKKQYPQITIKEGDIIEFIFYMGGG